MARLHVWIEGVVQGVFFRDTTRQTAKRLALTGWVRNLSDGRVEAVFEGDKTACEEALAYCNVGPPSAKVSRVECNWGESEEGFESFKIVF